MKTATLTAALVEQEIELLNGRTLPGREAAHQNELLRTLWRRLDRTDVVSRRRVGSDRPPRLKLR